MQCLLPLLILVVLHTSFGRLKLWRSASNVRSLTKWQLQSTDSDSSPPEPGKRSRFNEKMLNDAKNLREEALSMEAQYGAETNNGTTMDASTSTSPMDPTVAQFVSKFPEARKLAADVAASVTRIGNATTNETAIPYTSVLASRDQEAARKSLIDKLSGEVQKEPAKVSERNAIAGDENGAEVFNGVDVELTPLMKALSTSTDPVPLMFPSDTVMLFGIESSNALLTLPTLDQVCKTIDVWLLREIVKKMISLLLSDVDRESPEAAEEATILELAYALTVIQYIVDFVGINYAVADFNGKTRIEKIEASDVTEKTLSGMLDMGNFRKDAFLRADYIQFLATGQAPNIEYLRGFNIPFEFLEPAGNLFAVSEAAHWHVATLRRLIDESPSSREQRKLIWGIPTDVVITDFADTGESSPVDADAVGEPLSPLQQSFAETIEVMERIVKSHGNDTARLTALAQYLHDTNDTARLTALVQYLQEASGMRSDAAASEQSNELRAEAMATAEQSSVISTATDNQLNTTAVSRPEDLEAMDIPKMTPEQLREYFKPNTDGFGKMFSMVSNKAVAEAAEESWKTTAERFVAEYFDKTSRVEGAVISREGAGRFQSEVLRDMFITAKVTTFQGACIFDGRYLASSPAAFAEKLEARLQASPMAAEVGYTILMNEHYPSLEGTIEQAAIESLLGSSPAVVLFPKSWNSVVNTVVTDPGRRFWRNVIASAGVLTSASFAASALDMFNPSGPLITTGLFPSEFLSMSMVPLIIHYVSSIIEVIAGKMRGFDMTSLVVPSFTLPTFASRSTFTTMPANRNDLFDVAAIGIVVPLLLSFLTFAYGLQLTVESVGDAAAAAAFPTVSLSLLKTNTILAQMLSQTFPDIFQPLVDAAALADAASVSTAVAGVASAAAAVPSVHLHWLAIVGGLQLTAYTLQLIPLDNSAGSKLSYSILGTEVSYILTTVFGGLRFLFVLPMLFSLNAAGAITSKRLLFDYFVTSQLAGNLQENQLAKDNITPVSEGRVILYVCLVSLLLFSLVPFSEGMTNISESFEAISAYLQSLISSGSSGVGLDGTSGGLF